MFGLDKLLYIKNRKQIVEKNWKNRETNDWRASRRHLIFKLLKGKTNEQTSSQAPSCRATMEREESLACRACSAHFLSKGKSTDRWHSEMNFKCQIIYSVFENLLVLSYCLNDMFKCLTISFKSVHNNYEHFRLLKKCYNFSSDLGHKWHFISWKFFGISFITFARLKHVLNE